MYLLFYLEKTQVPLNGAPHVPLAGKYSLVGLPPPVLHNTVPIGVQYPMNAQGLGEVRDTGMSTNMVVSFDRAVATAPREATRSATRGNRNVIFFIVDNCYSF
jgi:hypothetical protein